MNTDKIKKALEQIQHAKRLIADAEELLAAVEGVAPEVRPDYIVDGIAIYHTPDGAVHVSPEDADKIRYPLSLKRLFGNPYIAHGKESLSQTLFGETLKPKNGNVFDFTRSNRLPEPKKETPLPPERTVQPPDLFI